MNYGQTAKLHGKIGIRKVFIFDLDGTLLDSSSQIISSVKLARIELKLPPVSESFLRKQIGLPAVELFSDLELTNDEKGKSIEIFRKFLNKNKLEPRHVFGDVISLLELLREHDIRICVATNKPTDLAMQALEDSEILHFFDFVRGNDGLPTKPDPAIINECLLHFRANPRQSVMIGDRCEDMIAAQRAKVLGLGVAQGVHSELELSNAGAVKVFRDISEILNNLRKGWNFEYLQ